MEAPPCLSLSLSISTLCVDSFSCGHRNEEASSPRWHTCGHCRQAAGRCTHTLQQRTAKYTHISPWTSTNKSVLSRVLDRRLPLLLILLIVLRTDDASKVSPEVAEAPLRKPGGFSLRSLPTFCLH